MDGLQCRKIHSPRIKWLILPTSDESSLFYKKQQLLAFTLDYYQPHAKITQRVTKFQMVLSTIINQLNMGYSKRLGQVILKDKSGTLLDSKLCHDNSIETRQIIDILYAKGFISGYKSGDTAGPYSIGVQIPITPCNIRNRMVPLIYTLTHCFNSYGWI